MCDDYCVGASLDRATNGVEIGRKGIRLEIVEANPHAGRECGSGEINAGIGRQRNGISGASESSESQHQRGRAAVGQQHVAHAIPRAE